MLHNLSPGALGITGRQSELIELALTFGFGGLNLDLPTIVRRARKDGPESACRLIASAGIRVGVFRLPVELTATEMTFRSAPELLKEYGAVGQQLQAACGQVTLSPVSQGMPYQECFELHRARLREIAELLEPYQIRLGVAYRAAPALRAEAETPFIHDGATALTLVRSIGHTNVGLVLDSWDWLVGGGTLEQLQQLPLEMIAAVRLADLPLDLDLASATELDRYMPGQGGQVDCRAIMQYLREGDYAGPVTLAPVPARFAGMTRDAIVQLAQATYKDLLRPTPPLESEAVEGGALDKAAECQDDAAEVSSAVTGDEAS